MRYVSFAHQQRSSGKLKKAWFAGQSIRHRKICALITVVVFVVCSFILFWLIGKPMLAVFAQPETFRAWVDAHGLVGRLAMIGMMALQIIVAIVPGEPLEIGAGYAFGAWEGTLLCLIGSVLGSLLVFCFVRRYGVQVVELFFSPEKIQSIGFLRNTRKLHLLMALLFLIPGTPKDLIGYCAGLTGMKCVTYLLITTPARIPSILSSTLGGNALGTQHYPLALVVLSITLCVSIMGLLVYRRLCRKESTSSMSTRTKPKETVI